MHRLSGINGDVSIDANGDRLVDYTMLDMNPETGDYEVVLTYLSANASIRIEPNKTIHWAGGRLNPPPDTPECGFDGSLCADESNKYSVNISVGRKNSNLHIFIPQNFKL